MQVAVVHRPRYDDWSLPKGKVDPGEADVLTAVREVLEETGFTAVVGRTLGQSSYRVLDGGRDVPKTVRWWSMRMTGGQFTPGPEVDRLLWLDVDAARRRVTGGRDDGPLGTFAERPPESSTVLLVRHASAGRSRDWDGPDEERPLDSRGVRQAQALAKVLLAYGPGVLMSAPSLRCRQTVQPLADRLGREVQVDDDLAEERAAALPGRLTALAAGNGATVACSQGGAIPSAVRALAAQAGLPNDDVPASKGSLWALSFSQGQLVDADYTAAVA